MPIFLEQLAPQIIQSRKRDWRPHTPKQLDLACRSLKRHGFVQPALIDSQNRIVCGWLMVQAAIASQLNSIPVLRVDHLTDEELRLYAIAANRLADLAGYDDDLLGQELQELRALIELPDFSHLGFEPAELDKLLGLTQLDTGIDVDDVLEAEPGPPISRLGDLWLIEDHRLHCADALESSSYVALMAGDEARFTLSDPPYNLPAKAISGRGRHKHQDFVQAFGEMSPAEFTRFLTITMRHIAAHSVDGSLHAFFMGYQFLLELLRAGNIVFGRPKALCTWVKNNGGYGALYRSRTEHIAYFKYGTAPYLNQVMLGKFGRNRTTAWEYEGMSSLSPDRDELLEGHPTPKPVQMLRDAVLDVTGREDVVLDPFGGSGSLILAAQAAERRAYLLELDPHYVDVALRRARKALKIEPRRKSDGAYFSELEEERGVFKTVENSK